MSLGSRTVLSLAATALGIAALLAPQTAAWADDAPPVAWSVSPADATGTADGRTRLEVALDPGKATTEHVTVANASTTEQTFKVFITSLVGVFVAVGIVLNLMVWMLVVRPVTQLSALADRVSQGDLDAPEFKTSSKDEIATLSDSFSRMRASVVQAMKMLE